MMNSFNDYSGKISRGLFKDILQPQLGRQRKEVTVGPQYGVDTALIDLGNNLGMAVSSDPLSLIPSIGTKASAWLSVQLLANDMATTGFSPMYAQLMLNLPADISLPEFEEYWEYLHLFCEEINVAITGGHTCKVAGLHSTISGAGTMFLTAPLDEIVSSNGAQPSDMIVVTKEAALSSTSILAMSFPQTVQNKLGKEVYDIACENFYQTSSLQDAIHAKEILKPNSALKAMHDVTEGGVVGAIYEMAVASKCGFLIDDEKIPTGGAQQRIADLFDIDHRFCIGAGSMVIAVEKGKEKTLVDHLHRHSIKASVVGKMAPQEEGFKLLRHGKMENVSFDGTDPYWEAFFKAYQKGLK